MMSANWRVVGVKGHTLSTADVRMPWPKQVQEKGTMGITGVRDKSENRQRMSAVKHNCVL